MQATRMFYVIWPSMTGSIADKQRRIEQHFLFRLPRPEFLASFLVLISACLPGFSQSPNRDPQAVAAVEGVLAALGGKDANARVQTAIIQGSSQTQEGQAGSSFLWEDDLTSTMPEFRKEIHSGDSVQVLVTNHGSPAHQRDRKLLGLPLQTALALPPLYLPGVVLTRQLNNPNYSIRWIPDDSGLIHIRTCWEPNPGTAAFSTQDWYFDFSTRLPMRVQYVVPNAEHPGQVKPASFEFSDFRAVSGVVLPFNLLSRGASQQPHQWAVTSIQINAPIEPAHFELNGGRQ